MDENQETKVEVIRKNRRRVRRGRYSGAFFFGLLLITLGVVVLLENMGMISWDVWDTVLRLWPVLLIAGGLDNLVNRQGIVGPVFWIGIGVILLLSTLGYLAWNAWYVILTMWPLLLVAIGLDILVGRRSIWGGLVGALVIIAMLVGTVWVIGVDLSGGVSGGQAIAGQTVTQTLDGAEQAKVTLQPSVGNVKIGSLAPSGAGDTLVKGTVRPAKGETVKMDYSIVGGRGEFTLRSEGLAIVFPIIDDRNSDWVLDLSTQIPLDMSVSLNAGSLSLDLKDLRLDGLSVNLLIGETTLTLPGQGDFSASVTGLIGDMVIIVPEGMGLRVKSSTGLGGIEVLGNFERNGNTYTTPGYESATNRVDLAVSQLIGQVTVEYK